ncbi:MAG: hypothetical protein CM1200mP2_20790 [Planctomycetaceae bacterium]|nr:MAG: hypothetical protein CM1200mP2_20790 [Planctomycetaceae bacterium]
MDIRQAKVPTTVTIGQRLVVDAQLVKNCRPQVINGRPVFNGVISQVVGRAISEPPLMPPPAIQTLKPNGLWSRPSVPCANGVRPNSPAQTTNVSSNRPRRFRSWIRPAIGWSTCPAISSWPAFNPPCWSHGLPGSFFPRLWETREFHEPNSPLKPGGVPAGTGDHIPGFHERTSPFHTETEWPVFLP